MVGEGHGAHGQLQVCPGLDPWGHSKGRADEKTGAAFAGIFHLRHGLGEGFAGQLLALWGKDTEPSPLGNLGENGVRLLFQSGGDLPGGGIFRQTDFRQLQQGEAAVAPQPLGVLLSGRQIKLFFQLAHGNQRNVKHKIPPKMIFLILSLFG